VQRAFVKAKIRGPDRHARVFEDALGILTCFQNFIRSRSQPASAHRACPTVYTPNAQSILELRCISALRICTSTRIFRKHDSGVDRFIGSHAFGVEMKFKPAWYQRGAARPRRGNNLVVSVITRNALISVSCSTQHGVPASFPRSKAMLRPAEIPDFQPRLLHFLRDGLLDLPEQMAASRGLWLTTSDRLIGFYPIPVQRRAAVISRASLAKRCNLAQRAEYRYPRFLYDAAALGF
jgi:hypothetical protein